MKILHINTEKTWRGGEQQTFSLLKGLQKRGISSHLVCPRNSPLAEKACQSGIQTFPIPMKGEIDPRACRHIRALIRGFKYDLLHSHTSHAHTLAFFASMGLDIRRLVTRRVDFSIFRHSFMKLSGIKYRYMADFYVAISHKIKEVLVNDGVPENRIFVAHSGIDVDRFNGVAKDHLRDEFQIKPHEQVVINVAHLAGHKGQQYLVRAIPLVLEQVPNVRFFIVGGGSLMDELQDLANSLGLTQELIFTGFRRDVGAFYQTADLFVMSSVQEGLGTAVLDALALGKPVVATASGGIPEVIQDGLFGRLVPPADPSALAAGMVELLTHPDQAKRMADKGRTIVRNRFSVDAMVDKNLEIYHRILKHHFPAH